MFGCQWLLRDGHFRLTSLLSRVWVYLDHWTRRWSSCSTLRNRTLMWELGDLTSVPNPRTVYTVYNKKSKDKIIGVEAQVLAKVTVYNRFSSESLRSVQGERAAGETSSEWGSPLGRTANVLTECLRCSPQRFQNSSGRKGNNQAQSCHVLSEGSDNCLMQSELCFLLHWVLHNIKFLNLFFSLKWEVRTVCISSGSCPWERMSKGNVFHGQKECFVFYGLGSSQNAVQPAIFMDPVLR